MNKGASIQAIEMAKQSIKSMGVAALMHPDAWQRIMKSYGLTRVEATKLLNEEVSYRERKGTLTKS